MTKNIILSDDDKWESLLPLTFTKPISELRIGILTIKEKWEKHLDGKASYITKDYLSKKYPIEISEDNFIINSRLLPEPKIVALINGLDSNEAILYNDTFIAARLDNKQFDKLIENKDFDELKGINIPIDQFESNLLERPYDIFKLNGNEIRKDFELLTQNKYSSRIDESVRVTSPENIFIELGGTLSHCIINASDGPVYIGKDATIMEGSIIKGPFAACDNSVVKMGAKIYPNTTLGPYSKVGGELNNVVIQGFSNKGHDGYLGNSVIGEWCNIGADTNSSNLKNNYSEIKLWNYSSESFTKTGLQFCGLIMGDHSKCGINTMFNTGTIVGVAANIFGSGYVRNFIPSFSWGGRDGFQTNHIKKVIQVAELVLERRQKELGSEDIDILDHVFQSTAKYRSWES